MTKRRKARGGGGWEEKEGKGGRKWQRKGRKKKRNLNIIATFC